MVLSSAGVSFSPAVCLCTNFCISSRSVLAWPGVERTDVLLHGGLHAAARDVGIAGASQELTSHGHFEGGVLPASRGIDVADVRDILLLGEGETGKGQEEATKISQDLLEAAGQGQSFIGRWESLSPAGRRDAAACLRGRCPASDRCFRSGQQDRPGDF